MQITMKYGKRGLPLEIPDGLEADVIRKKEMPVLEDPAAAVRLALLNPVGCRPLPQEVKGIKNVCIAICDITRPVPNGIVLPVLIQELIDAGVDPASITLLVATGLHRSNEGKELLELVGSDWILQRIRVVNHIAKNEDDHADLGVTPWGMPVKIDKRFVDADIRIVVGLIEPHFMAGYSGGRKVIVPGIAHQDTIRVLHSTRMLKQEGVENCRLEGNPLHEEQIAALRRVGRSLAVNTVIGEDRRVSFVNFGDIEKSHLSAVAFARPYFEIPVARKYKTVITSSAGYPLDKNYYQTVKGMVGVVDIVETGGDLFVVSECSEGLGTPEFAESQARLIDVGIERFLEETSQKEFASIDEWESIMQIKAMKTATIHLYSECLTREERALTGVHVITSLTEAIKRSVEEKNDNRVAVVPEGPYVVLLYRPGNKRGYGGSD
jgi:nickel-dependent lactate racemase